MPNLPRVSSTSSTTGKQGVSLAARQTASGPVNQQLGDDFWWTDAEAELFTQWASAFDNYNTGFNNPYFDYFYTGQDVQVTIDGLDASEDILPIYAFGYNIQQQKQPVYGFWDYTYSAMLRGTRIVTGSFSIVSMAPYLLTSKIAKAAQMRSQSTAAQRSANLYAIRGLDEDEALINTYWRRHYDANLDDGQEHIFSIHPPFNFILRYGLQETSLTHDSPTVRANDLRSKYRNGGDPMMSDFNERLVKNPVAALDTQILLENVEIVSKSMDFDSEGNPLLETYTFIARDERMLRPIDKTTQVYSPAPPDTTKTPTVSNPNPARPNSPTVTLPY